MIGGAVASVPDHTNGQLISNAACPASNTLLEEPSSAVFRPGSAAGEVASRCMICAAILVDGPTITLLPGPTIPPPAELTSELNHTTRPSYLAPCSSM